MILGDDGQLVVLEINTLPGMTGVSLFPEAAQAAGIGFPDLVARLVLRAYARHQARPRALVGRALPGRPSLVRQGLRWLAAPRFSWLAAADASMHSRSACSRPTPFSMSSCVR